MRLVQTRRMLFDRLDRVSTVEELLALQIDIAEAILEAERQMEIGQIDRKKLQAHIKCLRLYADALVWWNLHPHSIRQLAKNPGAPQSLLSQADAFNNVLLHAQRYCRDTRLPVLVADITNVLKIGDIIVVTDPECPQIVECKMKLPSPQHLMQGRVGRQISRAFGITQYLKEGAAKVFGENHRSMTVESQHQAERNWQVVGQLCSQALRVGEAYLEISPGDYLWALRSERQDIVLKAVKQKAEAIVTAQLGTSLGLMNFQDGLFAPPSAWRKVSSKVRFELIEGTIVLFHLVSYEALGGDYGDTQKITIRNTDYPIVVSIEGREYPLSRRFIYDIVYGFETIESCVRGLLTFAHGLASTVPRDLPDVPNVKPSMWYVETPEEISLLLMQKNLSHTDYVSMPRQLVESLLGAEKVYQSKEGLAVLRVQDLQRIIDQTRLIEPN